jgi:hypothetical protein
VLPKSGTRFHSVRAASRLEPGYVEDDIQDGGDDSNEERRIDEIKSPRRQTRGALILMESHARAQEERARE